MERILRNVSRGLFFLGTICIILYVVLLIIDDAGELLPICMLFIFPMAIALRFVSVENAIIVSSSVAAVLMGIFTCLCSYGVINIGYVLACVLIGDVLYFSNKYSTKEKCLIIVAILFAFMSSFYFISGYFLWLSKVGLLFETILLIKKKFIN